MVDTSGDCDGDSQAQSPEVWQFCGQRTQICQTITLPPSICPCDCGADKKDRPFRAYLSPEGPLGPERASGWCILVAAIRAQIGAANCGPGPCGHQYTPSRRPWVYLGWWVGEGALRPWWVARVFERVAREYDLLLGLISGHFMALCWV